MQIACNETGITGSVHIFSVSGVAVWTSRGTTVLLVSERAQLMVRNEARPDMAHELKEAIANAQIGLRYVSRHDLATGRLVARVGYLRWWHPQYGEIHPLELVRLAEMTGQAADLTRAALQRLQTDFAAFTPQWCKGVRISFGAPKHHILHEDFIGDIERLDRKSVV